MQRSHSPRDAARWSGDPFELDAAFTHVDAHQPHPHFVARVDPPCVDTTASARSSAARPIGGHRHRCLDDESIGQAPQWRSGVGGGGRNSRVPGHHTGSKRFVGGLPAGSPHGELERSRSRIIRVEGWLETIEWNVARPVESERLSRVPKPTHTTIVDGGHRAEQPGSRCEQRVGDGHVRGQRHRCALALDCSTRLEPKHEGTVSTHDLLFGHVDAVRPTLGLGVDGSAGPNKRTHVGDRVTEDQIGSGRLECERLVEVGTPNRIQCDEVDISAVDTIDELGPRSGRGDLLGFGDHR